MRRTTRLSISLVPTAWAAMALIGMAAQAQSPGALPDAGQVLREQVPLSPPSPTGKDKAPIQVPQATNPAGASSSARVLVKQLRVTGSTQFSAAQLAALAGDLVNREVSLTELYEAANRITAHYQAQGYLLARAYLPPQEIRQGDVEIAVIEGQVGAVRTDNRSLVSDLQVQRMTGVTAGQLVNQDHMERQLLLMGETPGVGEAYATLQPGERVGETTMGVVVTPGPRISGQVDLDNHGNRYTGRLRAGATLNVNSPLGVGDQLQLKTLLSNEELYNLRGQYRMPVGGSGVAMGATWSWANYDLGKEFERSGADGWARSYGVFISYSLVRSVTFNLLTTASLEKRDLHDRVDLSGDVFIKALGLGTVNLSGYGQTESVSYTFLGAYTNGRVSLRSSDAQNADVGLNGLGRRTGGGYDKFVGITNATWGFAPSWALYGSVYGQWAGKNLDSSERISLGGATGVRAYPQGEASGDHGVIGSVELRYNWPLRPIQLFGFVDAGRVQFNATNTVGASPNSRELSGIGGGLTWAPRPDVALRGMVAARLSDSQAQAEPDKRTRLWLQMLWRY